MGVRTQGMISKAWARLMGHVGDWAEENLGLLGHAGWTSLLHVILASMRQGVVMISSGDKVIFLLWKTSSKMGCFHCIHKLSDWKSWGPLVLVAQVTAEAKTWAGGASRQGQRRVRSDRGVDLTPHGLGLASRLHAAVWQWQSASSSGWRLQ